MGRHIEWKLYAQNPEDHDEQGIYLKAKGEEKPWTTETDCEEFDHINDPAESGILIVNLESAKEWAIWAGYRAEDVTEFEIW